MPKPKRKPKVHAHTFTGVRVAEPNRVYVPALSDRLTEEGMDHTLLFRWRDDAWIHIPYEVAINDVCVTDPTGPGLTLFSMSAGGDVSVHAVAGTTVETVDASEEGPNELLQLRSIRPIGAHVYVAGLGRHVYRRVGPDRWEAVDGGVYVPRAQRTDPVGFEAIDGLQESAIYAVGYFGEIWFYDGKRWVQQDSPTNVALTTVRCRAPEEVFVGGLGGTIVRGSNGSWEVIEQDTTEEDFWGMTLFRNQVYLSNYDGVFRLEDDTLEPVDMGLGSKVTTAYLDSDDQVMWSAGQKHLAMTRDGVTWTEIPKPN